MNRRLMLVSVAVAVVSAGCASTPKDKHDIGISRVGLTLAFSNAALQDAPVPPQVIIRLIPYEGSADLSPYVIRPGQQRPAPNPFACPAAPANAPVPAPAPLTIERAPKAGYYRMRNTGTIKLSADGFTFQFPYPPISTMQVTNVKTAAGNGVPAPAGTGSQSVTTFDVITAIAKNFETHDTYQLLGSSELDLVSHEATSSQGSGRNVWTPAVKIYDAGGPGTSWNALGTDPATDRAMGFQGAVSKSQVVDACGALIEAIEVSSTTTIADAGNRNTSGTTTPGPADLVDYATGLGGVIAARDTHTTEVLTVNNAPVTIVTDVKSTLMSLMPTDTP